MSNNPPTRILRNTSPEAEQRLIEFCETQIQKMSKYASLGNSDGQIGFDQMNTALSEYQSINLSLIAIYNLAKIEMTKAKETFDDWYAEKYIEVREEKNPRHLSAQKWYSTKEIEMEVRVKYKTEYKKYNEEFLFAEQKVAFLRRMLESWSSHQYILSQISKNIISEINGSKID